MIMRVICTDKQCASGLQQTFISIGVSVSCWTIFKLWYSINDTIYIRCGCNLSTVSVCRCRASTKARACCAILCRRLAWMWSRRDFSCFETLCARLSPPYLRYIYMHIYPIEDKNIIKRKNACNCIFTVSILDQSACCFHSQIGSDSKATLDLWIMDIDIMTVKIVHHIRNEFFCVCFRNTASAGRYTPDRIAIIETMLAS